MSGFSIIYKHINKTSIFKNWAQLNIKCDRYHLRQVKYRIVSFIITSDIEFVWNMQNKTEIKTFHTCNLWKEMSQKCITICINHIFSLFLMEVHIWRAHLQKGLDPFSIKFELLISQHYLSLYPLPLKRISDPNVTSKKKIL